MKKGLLASASLGLAAAPVAAQTPLRIDVVLQDAATARVTIGPQTFVLPDEQEPIAAALQAIPDKDRPVTLAVTGNVGSPYRVVGGMIYLAQSAGFQKVSVVTGPPAD